MKKGTYVVTGATGHVGRVVAEKLKVQGHEVRPVSRSTGVDLDDAVALNRAFSGADGAFLMLAPEVKAADLRRRQVEVGVKLASAVKRAGTRRIVFLSAGNAQYEKGTGPILGLHDMEERLNALGIAELVHLRPSFFMENHLGAIGLITQAGIYGTAFRPDAPLPMNVTRDVGDRAAEFLTEEPFRKPRVRELLGARDYTMAEANHILGAAIGKPDLKYVQFSYDEAREAMIGYGLSASYADSMMELTRSVNEGKVHSPKRSAENTTPRRWNNSLKRCSARLLRRQRHKPSQEAKCQASRKQRLISDCQPPRNGQSRAPWLTAGEARSSRPRRFLLRPSVSSALSPRPTNSSAGGDTPPSTARRTGA
jgi:uncharacterized protein YbjT (DUF2867 family)